MMQTDIHCKINACRVNAGKVNIKVEGVSNGAGIFFVHKNKLYAANFGSLLKIRNCHTHREVIRVSQGSCCQGGLS
jgi:hypothetical protein